jgi:hypothetical protein
VSVTITEEDWFFFSISASDCNHFRRKNILRMDRSSGRSIWRYHRSHFFASSKVSLILLNYMIDSTIGLGLVEKTYLLFMIPTTFNEATLFMYVASSVELAVDISCLVITSGLANFRSFPSSLKWPIHNVALP